MLIYTDTRYRPKRKPKKDPGILTHRFRAMPTGPLKSRKNHIKEMYNTDNIPSLKTTDHFDGKIRVRYEDQAMIDRELAAQKEIDRKKTMIAPLYNKGPYQMITPDTILSEIGKKI